MAIEHWMGAASPRAEATPAQQQGVKFSVGQPEHPVGQPALGRALRLPATLLASAGFVLAACGNSAAGNPYSVPLTDTPPNAVAGAAEAGAPGADDGETPSDDSETASGGTSSSASDATLPDASSPPTPTRHQDGRTNPPPEIFGNNR